MRPCRTRARRPPLRARRRWRLLESFSIHLSVNDVEDSVVVEELPLRVLPVARDARNGKEADRREARVRVLENSRDDRAIAVHGDQLLRLVAVEKLEVGLRD